MKKILILILVLILAVFSCLLVACDDGTESSSSKSEQESQMESEFQTESESQSESDSSVESESQSESKTESSSEESALDSEKESESQTETETQKPENTLTVKFDAQGGTPIDDAVTEKGEKVSKPSDPEKFGYIFDGWYVDGEKWSFVGYIVTEDMTLTAKWTPIEYTIAFVGATASSIKYTVEDTVTLPAGLTKTGYKFNGWFEDEEFTKPISKIDKGSVGDKTVYAKWTIIEYTITFVGATASSIKYTVEDTVTLPVGLTKTGYEFNGWFEDEKFTKPISKIDEGSVGDKTVYAKTTPIQYTITFVGNITNSSIKYTVEDLFDLPVGNAKNYYEFAGWFEDEALTKSISKIENGSYGNKTIYAKTTYHPLIFTLVEDTYRVSDCDNEAIKIVIPSTYNDKSVTSIGFDAFDGCTSLTSIEVDENNTAYKSINGNLYSKDGKILIQYAIGKKEASFVIPDSVTSIDPSAFSGCTSLTSVTIPNSVASIGPYAFSGCTSLTSVTIGDSVTSISGGAFEGCTSLTSIEVDENNTEYKSIDGNLYSKDGKTLIQYAIGKKDASFVIPDSVTSIDDDAFRGCTSLTSVTIGDSVTSISNDAFFGCTKLESITIPNSVTSIGREVFSNCTALKEINCEAKSQPIGWDYSWKKGCNATVVWGYTGE